MLDANTQLVQIEYLSAVINGNRSLCTKRINLNLIWTFILQLKNAIQSIA